MNTRYEIHVGSTNLDCVCDATMNYFPKGFTVVPTTGYWDGEREDALLVKIFGAAEDRADVLELARDLCALLGENCVLVSSVVVDACIVHNPDDKHSFDD